MTGPPHSIASTDFEGWLGDSIGSKHVMRSLRTLAEGRGHVLIVGEPGTGRDLAARALHDLGPRSESNFVRCLATEGLPEPGGLATAGTVFLDDVGSLPQADHGRLLEWLEEVTVGPRVVISAGPELAERSRSGIFSEAAYHFLAAVTVHLPPLREHPDDIPRLARRLLRTFAGRFGAPAEGFTEEAESGLRRHRWPGNFRELERRVLGAVLVTQSRVITVDDIWPRPSTPPGGRLKESLADLERSLVEQALREERGNVSRAARALGVSRPSLHNLLRKHQIDPAQYREPDQE